MGMIRWEGGECPVGPDEPVCVKYRDGSITKGYAQASRFDWSHLGNAADIVAYHSMLSPVIPTLAPPQPIIEDAFLKAYLQALPDGWARDEFSTNRIIGHAIAKGMAAAIKAWERR